MGSSIDELYCGASTIVTVFWDALIFIDDPIFLSLNRTLINYYNQNLLTQSNKQFEIFKQEIENTKFVLNFQSNNFKEN